MNALVESKNGATVSSNMVGYSHFPTESIDAMCKLRQHYRYEDMKTPYHKAEVLAGGLPIPQARDHLSRFG